MLRPLDYLAKEFDRVAQRLKECDDQQERKELLLAMRVIVDEADQLTTQGLKDYPEVFPSEES